MYEIDTKELDKAQNNDTYALQSIIEKNTGLLWSIIKRFLERGYDKEELYQIACIGFIKAIKRFNIKYDVKLSTYAVPYIIGEIKRFIRDDTPIKVSRSLKELNLKIKQLQKNYMQNKGEELDILKIAKILKTSKEEIILAMEAAKPLESVDEEIYNNEKNKETKINNISNGKDELDMLINRICINNLINELPEREKRIILLRYFRDKTQSEVAKIIGITQVQISRIEKRVLQEMRNKMKFTKLP